MMMMMMLNVNADDHWLLSKQCSGGRLFSPGKKFTGDLIYDWNDNMMSAQ